MAMRTALNEYIRSGPEKQELALQIPTYSFLLRSDPVAMFSDAYLGDRILNLIIDLEHHVPFLASLAPTAVVTELRTLTNLVASGASLTISSLRNLGPHAYAFPTELLPPLAAVTDIEFETGDNIALMAMRETAAAAGPSPRMLFMAGLDENSARPPTYDCSIYSVDHAMLVKSDSSVTRTSIIFSIRVSNNIDSNYRLREFASRIPLSPAASSPGRNYLLEDYEVAGLTMLSNLRFKALASFPTIEGVQYLFLQVVPCSSKGSINSEDI
ncbi:hypothetical protein LZ30DRAFT_694331 [Colletotrichum cereale]|nr:hypothetical protein LZ30DRAFT_694331 [Colletotrichum cereale]